MNRKIVSRVIIPILIIVELSFLFLTCMSYSNKDVNKSKETYKVNKKMFSMYVKNESTGEYDEYTGDYWPTGNYKLNQTETSCVDNKGNSVSNETLSFNSGKLTITSNKTVFCYLYFDLKSDIIIDVTTNGVSGFPTINKYKAEVSCDYANVEWNNKYQRIEFNSVTSDEVKCNLNYTSDTNEYTLLTKEISNKLATSTTNSGICSNETYTTQSTCEAGEGHWYYVSSTKGSNNEDAGIRYSGKRPSNWIWFNNELWRIIGIIPTKLSDGTETSLVKIIRADSIGGLSFHSAMSNTIWGGTGNDDVNTLYTLLNTKYYGKDDATGASPCLGNSSNVYALCNYKEIGISNSNTDYYGKMVKDVYWNVGTVTSTSTKITNTYTTEAGTKSTVTGRIALMNASDYGYATSGITYSSIGLSSLKSYTQNNWLCGEGYEWTLTPYSTSSVMDVYVNGNVGGNDARYGYTVRPVLYLDASVYVVSGEGTESNPYQIGM